MGNRLGAGGEEQRLTSSEPLFSPATGAIDPWGKLEQHFLNLLTSNIQEAAALVPTFKHRQGVLADQQKGRLQRLIARFYEARSNHKLAIKWTERALMTFEASGHVEGIYQCLRMLSTSHAHLGRYPRARHFAEKALAMAQLPREERLKIHINLGALEYRNHNYTPALEHFNAALDLLAGHADSRAKAIVLYNLANLYVCINKFAEAEANYRDALALFQSQNLPVYEAHVLQAFGNLYTVLGQYFHAETKLKRARDTYVASGDSLGAALCDIEVFRMEIRLNRFERALDRIPELTEAFRALGRGFETGLLFYHGIYAALAAKEYGLAEAYLKRASKLFKNENNQHFLALCTLVHGILLWRKGRKREALRKILRAKDSFGATKPGEFELECLIYACRIDENQLDKATFQRILFLIKSPLSPQVRTRGLILVSAHWYRRGQLKRSISSLLEAVNTIEESRASIVSKKVRASFFEDKTEIYELLIERLFQWKHPKSSAIIFKVMELSRGRQLSESLSRQEALPPVLNRDDSSVMERERLVLRLQQLNAKLEDLSSNLDGSETEKNTLLESIRETRGEIDSLKVQMSTEHRLGLFFPIELKPENLRELLEPGHVIVIFFLAQNILYRIEMDRERQRTYRTPLYQGFFKDFNLVMSVLSNRIDTHFSKITTFMDRLGSALYPKKSKNVLHYTFILHKTLQRFPLALLRKRNHYLIERFRLSQCPNLPTLYFALRKARATLSKPTFFFSHDETDPKAPERAILGRKFPRATVFDRLDNPAIPDRVAESDFIHFAGHCFFDKHQPLESYLQLAGRRMALSQYAKLDFSSGPFINLAACQSGWMVTTAGNEPYGFVISSFAAGAANILASLWEIDDRATGEWMDIFYGQIHLGLAAAYQKACVTMIARGRAPYEWGGFSLLGRP